MSSHKVKVPAWEWYGWEKEELEFPDDWTVHEQRMAGHDARALDPKEISEGLEHPVGTSPLRELARGKKKCVILFDDMTRATQTFQMIPAVLEELHKGGMSDEQIVFMMSPGSHGPRLLPAFQKKLGADICERFLVFNHHNFENFEYMGETSRGTPVNINREVASCDLKVVIGSIIPHQGFGFGGGAKMLLPGVCSIETIRANHGRRPRVGPRGLGVIEGNEGRLDSEEAARLAGIDFIVYALMNVNCDATDIFCGDLVDAHRESVKAARKHYVTKVIPDVDIAIGNGYPMANEGYKALGILRESVREGGDIVILLYTPEGLRIHYLNHRFGTDYGGPSWNPEGYNRKPWKMKRTICVTPQLNKVDAPTYGAGSIWVKSWKEALNLLKETHEKDVKVAIYPYATMQISEINAAKK